MATTSTTAVPSSAKQQQQQQQQQPTLAATPERRDRVILIPVSDSVEDSTRLLDWYSANLRGPADRLVLVRLLVPDCPADEKSQLPPLLPELQQQRVRDRGGSGSSSSASTSSDSATSGSERCPALSMEAQMERQLEASVAQEARLVRRLRQRGLRSFRFIHAFAREFTDCLLTVAAEQGAFAVLAPLSAFAAEHDLARTYHLYKMARIGIIHVPEF